MAYEGNRVGPTITPQGHDDSLGKLQHGVLSGTILPAVLVAELDTGALVIQGRPAAYLDPDDVALLKQELVAVLKCAEQAVPGNDGEAR